MNTIKTYTIYAVFIVSFKGRSVTKNTLKTIYFNTLYYQNSISLIK
jgi:hypothetical protein